jgi:uncharacterized Fe-S cluster protein YjdI
MKGKFSGVSLAVVLALLLMLVAAGAPASAQTSTPAGDEPASAILLEAGGDSGTLAPGESIWYEFSESATNGALEVDASITMFFVPNTFQNVGRVNFQVFPESELGMWYDDGTMGGDSSKMVNLGAGGLVDRDSNPATVDLLWQGRIGSGVSEYVQVYNSAKEPIDYWIFPDDVKAVDLGPDTGEVPAGPGEADGSTPFEAMPMSADGESGSLNPGESMWYAFSATSAEGYLEVEASITMFFIPALDQTTDRVDFQIFRDDALSNWYDDGSKGGDSSKMVNLGAGGLVERDSNPITADLLWQGRVGSGVTYYVEVYNSAKQAIDYWIFPEDVKYVELGPAAIPTPVTAGAATGDSPFDAKTLLDTGDTRRLEVGESIWYEFSQTSDQGLNEIAGSITMFFIPGNDQTLGRVNFQVFTADELSEWYDSDVRGGDSSKMVNLGAGGQVDRDSNPSTVDLLWQGNVGSGVTYYVQVYNSAKEPINFWLYPDDVRAIALGPVVSETPAGPGAPTGDTPFEGLPLADDGDAGGLGPGESVWYTFSKTASDGSLELDADLTMFFVPATDQTLGRVNFQVFPASELENWNAMGGRGGDTTEMVNLGAGGQVDRDSNPDTVDLLWSSQVGSGATYYVQVYNSAKEPISYWLFPEDVKAANLGE